MARQMKLSEAPPPPSGSVAERIRKERIRLEMTFDDFSSACKRSRSVQQYYEAGITEPNAEYLNLASIQGADIKYIVTGEVSAGKDKVSKQEKELVDNYRTSGKEVRAFAIGGMGCVLAVKLLMDDSGSIVPDTPVSTSLTIGKRIREEREQIGPNQTGMAKETGINKSKISCFETDRLYPNCTDLKALHSFGIDIVYAVCGYFLINLSNEEWALVSNYRSQPEDVKRAIVAALSAK